MLQTMYGYWYVRRRFFIIRTIELALVFGSFFMTFCVYPAHVYKEIGMERIQELLAAGEAFMKLPGADDLVFFCGMFFISMILLLSFFQELLSDDLDKPEHEIDRELLKDKAKWLL